MKESFWRDLYGQTVAQTAHHQRDRALLRGSATENPTYGVLCERRKCGPHHLLHLPEIQSGMENPHPQPIYTSCLTSPSNCGDLTILRGTTTVEHERATFSHSFRFPELSQPI